MAVRLVLRTDINTRDLERVVRVVPDIINNEPKLEIWIDNQFCADSVEDAMQMLRTLLKNEPTK